MTPPPWNAVRFVPTGRGHVESYFLKLNDGHGRRALWLKTTILEKRGAPAVAEAWAIAFDREGRHKAAKLVVPWESARFSTVGLDVEVGSVRLEEGATRGELRSGADTIAWDLRWDHAAPPLVPFPLASMYTGPFPKSKLVSPTPDALFHGSYTVNGERFVVDALRGMQGHNWGVSHTHRYAWVHVSGFDGEPDLVFEGLSGRVKVGPAVLPTLTLACLRWRGVKYEWNQPADLLRNVGTIGRRSWSFSCEGPLGTLNGDFTAADEDFVGLLYENPEGDPCHCLNSKIARGVLELRLAGRMPVVLRTNEAALELGTTATDHGIALLA